MILATEEGREEVEKRRDANADYRRLLNRWAVAAGKEHKSLASLTLRVLGGEEYNAAVAQDSNEVSRN